MPLRISDLLRDRRNVALLQYLRDDPRIGISALARRMGMSAPAVRERVQRLEEAGVIAGWRLDIDSRALGYTVAAYVRVRPLPGRLAKLADLAAQMKQVVECHRITGDDCFIMKIHLRELDELDRVLDRLQVHGQTTTSLVQSSPVPLRHLPLPGDPD